MRSVVVEQRYLDPDWRSEHGAFHGRLFRRHPSVCHRWHLFTDDVPADLSALRPEAYRGYVVLRPLPSTPVGRTMIAPPAGMIFVDLPKFMDEGAKWTRLFRETFTVR